MVTERDRAAIEVFRRWLELEPAERGARCPGCMGPAELPGELCGRCVRLEPDGSSLPPGFDPIPYPDQAKDPFWAILEPWRKNTWRGE